MLDRPRPHLDCRPVAPAFYITGGSLPPDAPSYVMRQADHELYSALRNGDLCYVLDTRQVGKSSLMVRTTSRLRSEGIRVVGLDLSAAGQNISVEQWYFGMLYAIGEQMGIADEMEVFWENHPRMGPCARWAESIRSVALAASPGPLVVFVDEIDSVLSLPFHADEFFAAIRELSNRRSTDPILTQLTFCLIGVATPAALIENPRTTPFNVGRRIELNDFSLREARALESGLWRSDLSAPARSRLLERIHYWTAGHPYLTQRLCSAVADSAHAPTPRDVDRICTATFLLRGARDVDPNLVFARDRMLAGPDHADRAGVLSLYAQVRSRKSGAAYAPTDVRADTLLLAGVARIVHGSLAVRNRIYARAFDRRWIARNMPGSERRRQRHALWRGVARASVVWGAVVLALGFGYLQRQSATESAWRAAVSDVRLRRLHTEKERIGASIGQLRRSEQRLIARSHGLDLRVAEARASLRRTVGERDSMLAGARAATEAERKRSAAAAERVSQLSGHVASALALEPGQEGNALEAALRAVEPATRANRTPSPEALAGVASAVHRGAYERLRLSHREVVVDASFSGDGRTILTAEKRLQVCLWDAHTGQLRRCRLLRPNHAEDTIRSAEYSPDGSRILVVAEVTGLHVLSASTLEPVNTPGLPRGGPGEAGITAGAYSADGSRIGWVQRDGGLHIVDLGTQAVRTLAIRPEDRHAGDVRSVAFSRAGDRLLTVGDDGTARVWSTGSGRMLLTAGSTRTHSVLTEPAIRAACFDRLDDGRLLLACAQGGVLVRALPGGSTVRSHTGVTVSINSVATSPDGTLICGAGEDGHVYVWARGVGGPPLWKLGAHTTPVLAARFSPDGRAVVTAGDDWQSQVWRITPSVEVNPEGEMLHVACSPDGKLVVAAAADGSVLLTQRSEFGKGSGRASGRRRWSAGLGAVRHVEFAAGGSLLLAAGDGGACLWRTRDVLKGSTVPLTTLSQAGNRLRGAAASPDGRLVATAGERRDVAIWDWRKGRILRRLVGHLAPVRTAAFSADGRYVVTAGEDGMARLWDAESGRHLAHLTSYGPASVGNGYPSSASLSPSNRWAIAAERSYQAILYNLANPRIPVLTGGLAGRRGVARTASFSPDGQRILLAGDDGALYLGSVSAVRRAWETRRTDAAPSLALPVHQARVNWACFAPDGRDIATASADGTARIVPSTAAGNIAAARRLLATLRPAPAPRRAAGKAAASEAAYGRLVLADRPASYWPLRPTPTWQVPDLGPSRRHGEIRGWRMRESAEGPGRHGVGLNGHNAFVALVPPGRPRVPVAGGHTLEVWVWQDRRQTVTWENTEALMASAGDFDRAEIGLYYRNGQAAFRTGGAWTYSQSPPETLGRWHHVAGVYDHRRRRAVLYIDGRQVDRRRVTGGPVHSEVAALGRLPMYHYFLNGRLAHAAVYNHPLSADTVLRHAQAGKRFLSP